MKNIELNVSDYDTGKKQLEYSFNVAYKKYKGKVTWENVIKEFEQVFNINSDSDSELAVFFKGGRRDFELQIENLMSTLESTSKAKKSANPRSAMLSAIMKKISGDRGEKLATAFATEDKDSIRRILTEVTNELSA